MTTFEAGILPVSAMSRQSGLMLPNKLSGGATASAAARDVAGPTSTMYEGQHAVMGNAP